MLTSIDKALVAGLGMVLIVLNALAGSSTLPAGWSPWVTLGIAVLTPIATYAIPNKAAK